jgi:hypothetical protein
MDFFWGGGITTGLKKRLKGTESKKIVFLQVEKKEEST